VLQIHSPHIVYTVKVLVEKSEAIATIHIYTVDFTMNFIWSIGNRFFFPETNPCVLTDHFVQEFCEGLLFAVVLC